MASSSHCHQLRLLSWLQHQKSDHNNRPPSLCTISLLMTTVVGADTHISGAEKLSRLPSATTEKQYKPAVDNWGYVTLNGVTGLVPVWI